MYNSDLIICANCGHLLYEDDDGKIEHYSRAYRPYGVPYHTRECHAPNCSCKKPQRGIDQLRKLRSILEKCWTRDTCFYKCQFVEKSGVGQCFPTSLLIQSLLGGKIWHGHINMVNHFWNELPNGEEVDLTSDQFSGDGIHPVNGGVKMGYRKPNRRCKRYLLLRERVLKELEKVE